MLCNKDLTYFRSQVPHQQQPQPTQQRPKPNFHTKIERFPLQFMALLEPEVDDEELDAGEVEEPETLELISRRLK